MKVAVLLSGGVDSSVALRLLQKEGHEVTAFYVKIWLEDELKYLGDCPWEEDLRFARAVCKQAGVPLKIISLQEEYWKEVVSYTIRELKAGRTPNPDMLCNQRIKFGAFLKKIDPVFEKVASGHYAQIVEKNGDVFLKRSPDPVKDQTYFLAYLKPAQMRKILFPLGKFTKQEVRKLAKKWNLPNKDRKDSQGICFLGTIRYRDFIKHHLGEKRGDFADISTGKKVGEHNGYWFFTIGQRHSISAPNGPWYVVKKNIRKNIVLIGRRGECGEKSAKKFTAQNINWISGKPKRTKLHVRIRHGGRLYPVKIKLHRDNSATLTLKKPLADLAPGQFAVLYDKKICLGGGIITSSLPV